MTFREQMEQATTNEEKERIAKHLIKSIIAKEQLNNISSDLVDFFAYMLAHNKLVDANGNPIRNVKAFLKQVNINKMSFDEWSEYYKATYYKKN